MIVERLLRAGQDGGFDSRTALHTLLALLRALVPPTPTGDLDLHEIALDIGLAVNHSTYDTLYVAFALATGSLQSPLSTSTPGVVARTRGPAPGA